MTRFGWFMLHIGFATLVLFTALLVVIWVDFSTAGDLSVAVALGIAAACVALGGAVQYFVIAKLRTIHGRS